MVLDFSTGPCAKTRRFLSPREPGTTRRLHGLVVTVDITHIYSVLTECVLRIRIALTKADHSQDRFLSSRN